MPLAVADARAVVVSPHLDDAVLSASLRLAAADAYVLTVFTGMPPDGLALPLWDRLTRATDPVRRMRERLAEDDAALARLGGVPTLRLDELDEQYRVGPALEPSSLAQRLVGPFSAASEVWLPSAIGGNTDHALVRDAGLLALARLPAPGPVGYLYADFPYVVRGGGWPSWVTGEPPAEFLDPAVWVAAELAGTGLAGRVKPQVRALTPAEQRRKRQAIEEYRSQLPALGLSQRTLDADETLLRHELAWRLT